MSPSAVSVRNLRKRYGAVQALDGVTFDVHAGEVFGLLGPNGAGKTTTVECVIGLTEPDSGEIAIAGLDRRTRPADVKRHLGAALQTAAVQDAMTAREAVDLFAALYDAPGNASERLARVGLESKADARFGSLSRGQQQRLALALAVVHQPPVLFLDEPTAGLDPQARRDLHREIAGMKHDGRAVLLTTHEVDDAEAICDRVAIIDKGRIAAIGTPADLVAASRAVPTIVLVTTRPLALNDIGAIPGVMDIAIDGLHATIRTPAVNAALSALVALLDRERIEIASLHVRKATLEDVFLDLTGSAA